MNKALGYIVLAVIMPLVGIMYALGYIISFFLGEEDEDEVCERCELMNQCTKET